MGDDVLTIVLALAAAVIGAAAGWSAPAAVRARALRRTRRFFGLPGGTECLVVVDGEPGGGAVSRCDAYALMELAALVTRCGARADVVAHDAVRQGFGARTEFCVGGPASSLRAGAHLRSLLPGVVVDAVDGDDDGGGDGDHPDGGSFRIGGETYRTEKGSSEYVLLARVTGPHGGRPVFLAAGRRGITRQAAVRHLAREHRSLARSYGVDSTFCLLLRVTDSDAYGPDVVELVADVTRAARRAPEPEPRSADADGTTA